MRSTWWLGKRLKDGRTRVAWLLDPECLKNGITRAERHWFIVQGGIPDIRFSTYAQFWTGLAFLVSDIWSNPNYEAQQSSERSLSRDYYYDRVRQNPKLVNGKITLILFVFFFSWAAHARIMRLRIGKYSVRLILCIHISTLVLLGCLPLSHKFTNCDWG